jgi:hypothetical protein
MRSTRVALAAIIVVFALGFLYIGTTHRDRCMRASENGCTILPWSGTTGSGASGWGDAVIP